MKRSACIFFILALSLCLAVSAQERPYQHPKAAQTPALTASSPSSSSDSTGVNIVKTWDLGLFPDGTYAELSDVNDFGFAVGTGELPNGETHTLGVALFGPHKGEWIDLGSLGGVITGWDEPLCKVSNAGLVATHSATADGHWHAVAWTQETGMFDLGTLADHGYSKYDSSYAAAVNRSGTLIVGWSSIEQPCLDCSPTLPVVWTPLDTREDGHPAVHWKMHTLDTKGVVNPVTGREDLDIFYPWDVNDRGQILGWAEKWAKKASKIAPGVPILWNPRPDGQGWKAMALPCNPDYPYNLPFGINNQGEIVGAFLDSAWHPAFWKPLPQPGGAYGTPILLKLPEGYADGGYADGINDLGDISGWMYGSAGLQALLWSSNDLGFSQLLGFLGDWSLGWKVNNSRIAVGGLGYGDTWEGNGERGGASQFSGGPARK
jgi:hypothetical protein